jgi:mannan polymerase II complex MNN11 subunit
MHFAYPPRKNSNPPPFRPKSTRFPALRRSRKRTLALLGLGFVCLLYLLTRRSNKWSASPAKTHIPSGSPPVVIVTVLSGDYGLDYMDTIKENRISYAKLHGGS